MEDRSDLVLRNAVAREVASSVDNIEHIASTNSSIRLKCIASPTDSHSPSFDIVAIHGERGDIDLTWTDRDTGYNWLRDALPSSFPSAAIYSYSLKKSTDNVVETLLYDLLDERSVQNRSEVPIFFIGHSLGGTLAKRLFVESSPPRSSFPRVNNFHTKISGFVFMGTRQKGSFAHAEMLTRTLGATSLIVRSKQLKDLQTILADVPVVNSEFLLLRGERKPLACFYEGVETNMAGTRMTLVSRTDAIIENDGPYFRENRQLDRSHANLAKFSGSDDPDLKRVIATMNRLIAFALSSDNESSPTQARSMSTMLSRVPTDSESREISSAEPSNNENLRLLSLDGGGVRGLFTVIVLEALMEEIRILTGAKDDVKPCDFFDLIGGTSTGGLLAVMLARLRMDLMSCKKQYRDLSKIIFEKRGWSYPGKSYIDAYLGKSWYPAESLETAIKSVVAERISVCERKQHRSGGRAAENAPLRSEHVSKARCFVCAIRQANRGCARLRSYATQNDDADITCTIWEACRATSAAQLYFPPMQIGTETYWDGGSESNNPVQETFDEAYLLWNEQRPITGIVSIGTGMPTHRDPGRKVIEVVQSFISHATDTESTHLKFKERHPQCKDIYFRLQGSLELGAIDLADCTKLDMIEKMAQEYVDSEVGRSEIQRCARQLIK